mgnify:CR=1 FL=1
MRSRSIIFDWRSSSTLAVSRGGLTSFLKAGSPSKGRRGGGGERGGRGRAAGQALSEIPGNDKVSRRSLNPFVARGNWSL